MTYREDRHSFVRSGLQVARWHTCRTNRPQSVGEHTAGLLAIIFEICEPSIQLVRAALEHDVTESFTGDLPAPMKWKSTALNRELEELEEDLKARNGLVPGDALPPNELMLLKFADSMELFFFVIEELHSGNRGFAETVGSNIKHALDGMLYDRACGELPKEAFDMYEDAKAWFDDLISNHTEVTR
jgi:5'-deoxynucleotidase YfbR-like HD superfamily hydrolase